MSCLEGWPRDSSSLFPTIAVTSAAPHTEEGFMEVQMLGNSTDMEAFILRLVAEDGNAISNQEELRRISGGASSAFAALREDAKARRVGE